MTQTHVLTPPRRPWHLWLVGAIGMVWSVFSVISFVITQTRVEAVMSRYPPQQRAYFESFPPWAVTFWGISVAGGIIGCVLLLLSRRSAYPALLTSAIAAIAFNGGGLLLLGGMTVMRETDGLGLTAIPVIASALLAFYAYAMRTRGMLR